MTEKELLTKYADEGDPEAFCQLSRAYSGMVYGTCLSILKDPAAAEDAAQETFLQLARHASNIHGVVGAWLHRVATRKCLDALRAHSRRKRHETNAAQLRSDQAEPDPGRAEFFEMVDEAIEELPDELKDVLILRILKGQTLDAVASELEIAGRTVSRRIDRAVLRLRGILRRRGVIATATVLTGWLMARSAEAAPVALLQGLGKIAASGVGSGGAAGTAAGAAGISSTTAGGGALTGGLSALKLCIAAGCVAAAAVATSVVVRHEDGSEQTVRQPVQQTAQANIAPPAPPVSTAPIAESRDYTETDFWIDVVRAHQHMETEGYRQHGHRDPAWDQRAIALLNESAKLFTASDAPAECDPQHLGGSWINREAGEILDMGCEDPMIFYVFATTTYGHVDRVQGLRLLREAADKLEESEYHPVRKHIAWGRCAVLMPTSPEQPHFWERGQHWIIRAWFMKEDLPGVKRWMVRMWGWMILDFRLDESDLRTLEEMADVDPWMRDLALGLHNKSLALEARGPDPDAEMTEENERLFQEHLKTASEHLIAAHNAHPERPEAATVMIEIAKLGGETTLSASEWFDRAIAAQSDYTPAYTAFGWVLPTQ